MVRILKWGQIKKRSDLSTSANSAFSVVNNQHSKPADYKIPDIKPNLKPIIGKIDLSKPSDSIGKLSSSFGKNEIPGLNDSEHFIPKEEIVKIQVFDLSAIKSPYTSHKVLEEYSRITSDNLYWEENPFSKTEHGYVFKFSNIDVKLTAPSVRVCCLFNGHWYLPTVGDATLYSFD